MLKFTSTVNAPSAIGPYSQAVSAGGFVYTSGSIAFNAQMQIEAGADITAQTRLALHNMEQVLLASGSSLQHVVKTTVFLKDMDEFAQMNSVYAQVFGEHRPARSAVEVARLPRDAKIEIECVARAI